MENLFSELDGVIIVVSMVLVSVVMTLFIQWLTLYKP